MRKVFNLYLLFGCLTTGCLTDFSGLSFDRLRDSETLFDDASDGGADATLEDVSIDSSMDSAAFDSGNLANDSGSDNPDSEQADSDDLQDASHDARFDSETDASSDSGSHEDADVACGTNNICATVVLPAGYVGTPQRMMLVLYNDAPDLLNDGVPTPDIRYPVVDAAEMVAEGQQKLIQDFTDPVQGDEFTDSSYYVGVIVFVSSATLIPEDGVDYWIVTPTAEVLANGLSLDLGEIEVEQVPMLDDPDTVGNDLPGYVECGTEGPCDLATNVCCLRVGLADYCEASPECVGIPIAYTVACDGPEDCADDEVCCGAVYEAPICSASSECPVRDLICHTNQDCDGGACQALNDNEQTTIDNGEHYTHCDVDDPTTIGDDRAGWVMCETDTCDLATEYCCDSLSDLNCVDKTAGQCGTISAKQNMCDGPEDCVGSEKCCSGEEGFRCRDDAGCFSTPSCHTDDDCSNGETCTNGRCVTS